MMQRQWAVAWKGALGIALGLMLWHPQPAAAEDAKPDSKASSPAPASSSATAQIGVEATPQENAAQAGNEKIVHTFEDPVKLEEFKKIWQQRQGILVRMSVLQAYWGEEQTLLDQLNHTLSSQYALDITKSYYLDSTRRVLIEQETPKATQENPSTPSPKP